VKSLLLATIALTSTFCCCLLFAIKPTPAFPPTEQPLQGQTAPDFTLESLDNRPVTLSALRGQVVVLDFWATWCGPCVESLPHLQDIHDRYAGQGVVVLAINIHDDPEEVARFVRENDYTFTILLDPDREVADAYGVWGIPHTVVVDAQGILHQVPEGPAGVEEALQGMLEQ